ncbi:CBS domain-containing protein [Alteromonas sp. ASW11-19]|uniref:CBS domain-containing protein n=1 Tax=Alteromonas salexigens TaxID=2982530 RepID=A0ABT2VSM1_9ALTE|nr:CBS domain-containing protein [Alteromonas salexigens]MCU7555236.1 CBS domain-containing protein [Alteromonas salexigens]
MSVAQIMTSRVVSVSMDDSLATLQELFHTTGFHHLIVVEQHEIRGIISDRDLLKAISPFIGTYNERDKDRATLSRKAHQIMTRKVLTVRPEDTIVSAIRAFNQHKISCLPVVDAHQRPVGIISWRDILRYAEDLVNLRKRQ